MLKRIEEFSSDRPLTEGMVHPDPIRQFGVWYEEAERARITMPNAMVLATSTPAGKPSARVVLLKDYSERGFTFFTNYRSRKGNELELNPYASLVFHWKELERQVRIDGSVSTISEEESNAYFRTRPRESQIGALASHQSSTVPGRKELEDAAADIQRRFEGVPVPRPEHWGGYCVYPEHIEFWQGRKGRLHDRLLYSRSGINTWTIVRLQP